MLHWRRRLDVAWLQWRLDHLPWFYIKKMGASAARREQRWSVPRLWPSGEFLCSDFSLPHCHHHGPHGSDPNPTEGKPGCPQKIANFWNPYWGVSEFFCICRGTNESRYEDIRLWSQLRMPRGPSRVILRSRIALLACSGRLLLTHASPLKRPASSRC